jgi:hypothetical protein
VDVEKLTEEQRFHVETQEIDKNSENIQHREQEQKQKEMMARSFVSACILTNED